MTEQSEHLSSAQIENYGIRTSGAGPEAAQRDEHQRLDHQSSDDQRVNVQEINDQRVEAHLADCASCRNRLLDFHRSLFASPANPPAPDRPKADTSKRDELKRDELKNDPPEHDTSLSGHSPSGHSPSGQRPADSRVEGASPTGSALADSKFANPKYPVQSQVRTAPTPECPSDDALRELAAGLTPEDVAAKLTQHAATCNHCGPLLRTYTEIFSDDFTPEEQAALANLQSSSADWQKNTARQMMEAAGGIAAKTSADASDTCAADKQSSQQKSFKRSATTTSGRKPFFWKWAPATAAIVAVATFSIWYTQRDTPEKVQTLLAQAYADQRTMEMRIPDAKYSEFHQRRSGEPSSSSQLPESFHKAAEAISSELKAHPDDPKWLLLSSRLDLLNWQFKQALETLEKIENKDPARQLEIDSVRAMALYEKAAYDSNQPEGYGDAVQFLKNVLEKNPNDPVALHNQAVACEKAHLYDCAIEDWSRLLTIEKDPGWAGEAQRHLDQIQEKKSPALTPSQK